ncbi:PREDICTED: von Willebrand factor A domain-containing protein 5A-like [Cyprinodon variegatus]|uniref:von Willebrand factor A domain-containing protein 5A-like n=1 Tax=Cyprinodon variegatus TaxID=28743 RepID=UPI0007426B12|nr:PREDICTED: von Willebrand factor A domain-containing protein 5A-like [Cyprinodon variegatus]
METGHKFDRDIELLIYYKDAHQPTAVVEAGQASAKPGSLMGDPVVMVSLYPEFPQSVMSSLPSCGEFVLLMDRSGSMGCPLNNSMKQETRISSARPCIPKHPRQLFVFTDGEVGNTKAVIDLVKKNSGSHRCFSFGIGEGASSALINGVAKEGGGHAQFITGTDRMQPKVMQSLRFALQPAVEDVSVSWDLPKGVSATILSPPIKAIFQGQRSLIYAQLTGQSSEGTEGSVTVKYTLAGHPSQNQLHFDLKPAEDSGLTVHRLASRTVIRSLESEQRTQRGQQDEEVKKKVVELSVQSGVSSSLTAFIAVNKASGKAVQGPLVRRNIPTAYRGCMIADCSVLLKMKKGSAPKLKLDIQPPKPPKDPLLQLVSLQKASGFWQLDADLAAVFGKNKEEVEKSKPKSVNNEVWASILALIWLHGFKMDAKEEWELLTMKTASWIKAQNAPCVPECVEAGNTLLGCSVKKEVLGL